MMLFASAMNLKELLGQIDIGCVNLHMDAVFERSAL